MAFRTSTALWFSGAILSSMSPGLTSLALYNLLLIPAIFPPYSNCHNCFYLLIELGNRVFGVGDNQVERSKCVFVDVVDFHIVFLI